VNKFVYQLSLTDRSLRWIRVADATRQRDIDAQLTLQSALSSCR